MKVFALDIGGSFIKSAVMEDGTLTHARISPTDPLRGAEAVMADILALAHEHADRAAVGISFAGQIDPRTGEVTTATSAFPGFTGLPLREILERELGVPAAVDNDVNCAAIAEGAYGAMKGRRDFLCLTYGTGIGGAIVLDGKLLYGSGFAAGEVGHMTTHGGGARCNNCGRLGCYEQYASTTALTRAASGRYGRPVSGRELCALWEAGDKTAASLIEHWVQEVVYGLSSCIHTLNPGNLVLGGGIMENAAVFALVRERLLADLLPNFAKLYIAPAALGNRAGLIGAGVNALQRLQENCRVHSNPIDIEGGILYE